MAVRKRVRTSNWKMEKIVSHLVVLKRMSRPDLDLAFLISVSTRLLLETETSQQLQHIRREDGLQCLLHCSHSTTLRCMWLVWASAGISRTGGIYLKR
jgi:hypothetical protein